MENLNSVLLIDDDDITNIISHKLLQSLDICENVHSFSNAIDALDYIHEYSARNENQSPELILLDVNMPVMSGIEFLKSWGKLNFSNRDKVVIVTLATGYDGNDIVKAKKLGVNEFLLKPLTREGLQEILHKYYSKIVIK
ncbi:MAG TPA: response regulator [Cytophagaceae bacterium]